MQLTLNVQTDFLEREAASRPIAGIAELVWNAVDADATVVEVVYKRSALGYIESVTVSDNGHGIAYNDAIFSFEKLGGSWKKTRRVSKGQKRDLHGQEGKGRFKAFSIGDAIEWESTYQDNGTCKRLRIVGKRPDLNRLEISDPVAVGKSPSGTSVSILSIRENVASIDDPAKVAAELSRLLAIYLRKYPAVSISIEGIKIDPSSVESHVKSYRIGPFLSRDGKQFTAELGIIEWKVPAERALYLCDSKGFAKAELAPGIQAPGWNFTAYLASDFVTEMELRGTLGLGELDQEMSDFVSTAKKQLREHFRVREAELAADLVEAWKREGVYPYPDAPKNVLEAAERQIFDVVALQLSEALPTFEASESKNKRFSLRLLKQAIERSPEELQTIFTEVLGLTAEQQSDLAKLLQRTSLSAIISAAKTIASRLEFLRILELLVFDKESANQLKERTQLHKLLEDQTWLWGEEFALSVSDKSLDEVLNVHIGVLGKRADKKSVRREDGTVGRVDLMLSRLIPQARSEDREHLVVELKRPSVSIDADVFLQVQSYASAVADDSRFKDTNTKWNFWAVSKDVKPSASKFASQRDKPRGLAWESDTGHIRVWIKSWGEIIEANRARLQFFQQKLQFKVDDESALAELRRLHSKYLPPRFQEPLTTQ